MPRQRHEARLEVPITNVFAALVDVAARGRWGTGQLVLDAPQPRAGCIYAQQRGTVFRRGKVLECLRPVSMTLQETLFDPPCYVKLRLHWRLDQSSSMKVRIYYYHHTWKYSMLFIQGRPRLW